MLGLWRLVEPSLWTREADSDHSDPGLSMMRTLFDQPRWLEACHLYDERGAQLFDRICELPEYYLTRTENSILAGDAARVIAAAPVERIVELGAGFAKKTMHLLREQVRQRGRGTFVPIDVSLVALAASRDAVMRELPQLEFQGLLARYDEAISRIDDAPPTLFVFLGSSVGNFTPPEFVRFFDHLSRSIGAGDFFLLGVDRIKEADILEKAYNDSRGVTAEFILNVFEHINRVLKSDFDRQKMRYSAWYNREWRQVEMYAVSTASQEIRFRANGCGFLWESGDRILVEISRKFDPERLQEQLRLFNLDPVAHFADEKNWFSLLLFRKSKSGVGGRKET